MIKLLKIEWIKLKHFKAFWILLGSFAVVNFLIGGVGKLILNFLKNEGVDIYGISPSIVPLYDFPDVWQNMAYILGYFKVILAFILVISICNEFSSRIVRQNIIDGLSKKEWLTSKLLTIFSFSIGSVLLLYLTGLVYGLFLAHPHSFDQFFANMDIFFGYFLEIFAYLCFTLLVTLIIRKPGIVIIGLFIYTLMFEPFVSFFISEFPKMPDFYRPLGNYFPVRSMMNLIHPPYPKYYLSEIQDFITFKEVAIVLGWIAISIGCSHWWLKRKDL